MTIIALALFVTLLLAVAALLERNQRRTSGVGRAPYGADVEADYDLARTRTEVAANVDHVVAA